MIVAIVQARMGSTRLPGKVMRVAAGKTFLGHLLERLAHCRTLDKVIVATSTLAGDDAIAGLCGELGTDCFRGSERDVLDRYYQAALSSGAGTVVRITADCPLIDPAIVDRIVAFQQAHAAEFDLVTNRYPLTFPDGLDVDVMPLTALAVAHGDAGSAEQREHVIPYFWQSGKRVKNIAHPDNLFYRYRWTVDYEEDAQLVAAIFEGLYQTGKPFGLADILEFLAARPALCELNARYLPEPPKA